jgi:uncharacterized OsmC-like protein
MNARDLKAMQAPIKERYRNDPGVARDAPVGFREIRLRFDLDTDAPQEQRKKLVELTECYCVVLQTIRNAPLIKASLS